MVSEVHSFPQARSIAAGVVLSGLLIWAPGVLSQAPGLAVQKNVHVELEECLDPACATSAPMPLHQAVRLETTLWNHGERQGLAVMLSRYRSPNSIWFGDVAFDQITFGPTRSLEQLYDVDRGTFWPIDRAPFVSRRGPGRYVVRIPRRGTTFLLPLSMDSAALAPAPTVAPEVIAVPEFLGIGLGLFGLLETHGIVVTWNGKWYAAFPRLRAGAAYQLRLRGAPFVFVSNGKAQLAGVRWKNAYDYPSTGVKRRQ